MVSAAKTQEDRQHREEVSERSCCASAAHTNTERESYICHYDV